MKVKPLGDRVLVQREEETDEQKSDGGIIIPDTVSKEKPQRGKVIAVGQGARNEAGERIAMDVSEGDEVLFGKYSGNEIKIDGEDLLILRESDIFGILES